MSAAAVVPALHHYLFILAPKKRPEQTARIFLSKQEREYVAQLQPSANLCLYSHVLYFIYKKREKIPLKVNFCLVISTQKKRYFRVSRTLIGIWHILQVPLESCAILQEEL